MPITLTTDLSYDTTAYNTLMWFALRPEMYFDPCADVRTSPYTHNGASVSFNFVNDIAPALTPLTENTDVTSVVPSDQQVTITPQEYGNAIETSQKFRATSYIPTDPIVANLIGYNAAISIDTIARNALMAGTNVVYGKTRTSRVTLTATDTIDSSKIRRMRTRLVRANVKPWNGAYRSFIHPDVALDLREETGDIGWRTPHNYSAPEAIMNGSIGMYEGFDFIETPRAPILADTGAGGTVDTYQTLFLGQEGLAKGYNSGNSLGRGEISLGADPVVVPGPVVDKLRRFVSMGWYHYVGYGIFRQDAVQRLETASSVGVNT